jgi:hypothetical protein
MKYRKKAISVEENEGRMKILRKSDDNELDDEAG